MLRKIKEFIIEKLILLCGLASVIFVALIFIFLLKEGLSVFKFVRPGEFLAGRSWYPISEPAQLGILPLILGSLWVTFGAAVISVPIGVGCAVYIAEIAPGRTKEVLKGGIELLAAIPSVVLGFIGMVTLVPLVKNVFHLSTGLTGLSGSIILAFMAMPTIVSIAEDALYAVPKSYKEGAFALGATHWQTIWRVLLPAASSGIVAAVMLGIGRVIGETMAVMMITGNSAVIPRGLLEPLRTLTATIAAEMGEAVVGSEHYFALFAIGIILFIISFAVNVTADLFLHKNK
ncbi:MAG TPA: phosphate ABC transporter permease subunit PstC [Candidatus Omnitrophota bacterium]|nr:phosphate ABC transporter permease subunit PstC [Candidatus Omnitrophota bacterium]HNQ50221.1 phosphate ABC transporter permease subunit PstC [Candidatus Omnitrophota bacterium]HQO37253.1 phosphate ABC transporter permease subunit PstC [Candidatus Omnitrophota bacterium]HQQ05352.1 phosphate ABC transporter permease subunit PstC [Candidatus Omnitrophota bacterium]